MHQHSQEDRCPRFDIPVLPEIHLHCHCYRPFGVHHTALQMPGSEKGKWKMPETREKREHQQPPHQPKRVSCKVRRGQRHRESQSFLCRRNTSSSLPDRSKALPQTNEEAERSQRQRSSRVTKMPLPMRWVWGPALLPEVFCVYSDACGRFRG